MSDSDQVDVVVIGAGVVGCAVAQTCAARGQQVVVLEAGPRIAEGVTSRNSGVIHAGLYYPPGSLKAETCIFGNVLLYDWCEKRGVAHKKCGKWIVATSNDEIPELEAIFANAKASGAVGLHLASRPELEALQVKGVKAVAALFSSQTGIIDPFEYSLSFLVVAEEYGAIFSLNSPVKAIERKPGGYLVKTARDEIKCSAVVNAAGLASDEVARLAGVTKYQLHPWRGDYFWLKSKAAFDALVYPVKKKGSAGLGIHLTLSLDGRCRLGPDVKSVASKTDFAEPADVESLRKNFFDAAVKYLPGIRLEDLSYDAAGIRPKLRAPHEKEEKDFIISEDLPRFINLIGIESPGLTAAIELARRVSAMLS